MLTANKMSATRDPSAHSKPGHDGAPARTRPGASLIPPPPPSSSRTRIQAYTPAPAPARTSVPHTDEEAPPARHTAKVSVRVRVEQKEHEQPPSDTNSSPPRSDDAPGDTNGHDEDGGTNDDGGSEPDRTLQPEPGDRGVRGSQPSVHVTENVDSDQASGHSLGQHSRVGDARLNGHGREGDSISTAESDTRFAPRMPFDSYVASSLVLAASCAKRVAPR